MVEGLAEYVSDPTSAQRRSVLRWRCPATAWTSIVDTSGKVNKQDLEHLTILEKDVSLAYGLAASLVGLSCRSMAGWMAGGSLWRAAYDKAQKLDTALQQAFGLTYEQFDAEWRAWLQERYGWRIGREETARRGRDGPAEAVSTRRALLRRSAVGRRHRAQPLDHGRQRLGHKLDLGCGGAVPEAKAHRARSRARRAGLARLARARPRASRWCRPSRSTRRCPAGRAAAARFRPRHIRRQC